jgi:hypothetical protein
MTDREKLIELLEEMEDLPFDTVWSEADFLIENGVTFATDNNVGDKWISVKERLPSEEEYTATSEDGTEYYARLLIAYKTDIVEYEIGYYDGYKWMTEMPINPGRGQCLP